MKTIYPNDKGFTLVEIMVVVVIIGLLVAIAAPVFQKARQASLEKSLLNDGRQFGAAIQQYCMEYSVTQAPSMTYDPDTGLLSGEPNFLLFLKQIGKNYSATLKTPAADATDSFKLKIPGPFGGSTVVFSGEGKMMGTE
jgi:type IV pilus assembly protein PilA